MTSSDPGASESARLQATLNEETRNGGNVSCRAAAGYIARPGLVSNATSHTITVDPIQARLRKMSRAVYGTALAIQECLQKGGFLYRAALITLTYAPGQQWEAKDVSRVCNHYRMWA